MARDPVKISRNLDDNALANELYVGISDGTEQLLVNADGSLNATINNASLVVTATDLDIRDLSATQDSVAISDGTDSLAVNADGSINAVVSATDLDIRNLSAAQDNVAISDGTDTLAIATDGSIAVTDNGASLTVDGTVAATQSGTWDIGTVTSITNAVTVTATDLDIRNLSAAQDNVAISDGTDSLAVNADGSINVVVAASAGTSIVDYSQATALASLASSNHDYTATGGSFEPLRIEVSGESIGTFQILANAVVVGVLRTSVENPNAVFNFPENFSIADTQVLRVVRTNDSNKAHNFDSTIIGYQN